MSSPAKDKIKGERGGFLSQSQYHDITQFLGTGELPQIDETDDFPSDKNRSQSPAQQHDFENMRQFRGWARRMFLEDGLLKHKLSGKIILPKDMFVQIIKEMHSGNSEDGSCRTSRHLGVKRTIEKIQSKYTMGKRSFGMNEDLVKTIVKNCRSGSCQKQKFKKKFNIDAMKSRKLNQESLKQENKVSSPFKWKNQSVRNLIKQLNAKKSTASATVSSNTAALNESSSLVPKPTSSNELSREIVQNENKPFPVSVIKYTPQGIVCEPINITSDSQKFSFILPTTTQQALSASGITHNVFNFPNIKPLLVTNAANQNCQSSATIVPGNSNQLINQNSSSINKITILPNSSLNTSDPSNVMFCVVPTNSNSSFPTVKTANFTTTDDGKLSISKPIIKPASSNAMLGGKSNFQGTSNLSSKTANKESSVTLSGMKKRLRAKIKDSSMKKKFASITKQDACRNLTDALNNCSKNILKQNKKIPGSTTFNSSSGCERPGRIESGVHTVKDKKLKIKQIPGINDTVLIELEDETEQSSPTGQTKPNTEHNPSASDVVQINSEEDGDGDVIMLNSPPEINTQRKYEIKIPVIPRPGPLPYPPIWYYSKDLAQQTNCYTSLLMSIHDLKIDITKSYLRDLSAIERVKKKLCYLETLTKKVKTFTERCKAVDFDVYMDAV